MLVGVAASAGVSSSVLIDAEDGRGKLNESSVPIIKDVGVVTMLADVDPSSMIWDWGLRVGMILRVRVSFANGDDSKDASS